MCIRDRAKNWIESGPPHWLQLVRSLGVRNTFVRRDAFERCLTSQAAQQLRSLDLKMCRFQTGTLEALSVDGNLPKLSALDLGVLIDLSEREVISLASSTLYGQLDSLRLSFGLEANPLHVRELMTSTSLHDLKVLRPGGYNMGTLTAVALAEATHMNQLVELDLMGNDLGEEGAAALASASHLDKLTVLMLARNYIGPDGAIEICEAPQFSRLELLDLRENFIGARGARALARSEHLSELEVLQLNLNPVGDRGAHALANSKFLSDALRAQWAR